MSGKLHLIRCNLNDISYLSETQKNYFQFFEIQLFVILSPKYLLIMFSLKLSFQLITFHAFRLRHAL